MFQDAICSLYHHRLNVPPPSRVDVELVEPTLKLDGQSNDHGHFGPGEGGGVNRWSGARDPLHRLHSPCDPQKLHTAEHHFAEVAVKKNISSFSELHTGLFKTKFHKSQFTTSSKEIVRRMCFRYLCW